MQRVPDPTQRDPRIQKLSVRDEVVGREEEIQRPRQKRFQDLQRIERRGIEGRAEEGKEGC